MSVSHCVKGEGNAVKSCGVKSKINVGEDGVVLAWMKEKLTLF